MSEERGQGEIVVYRSSDGLTKVDVRMAGDTVWLTQAQLIELYHSSKSNISEHIKHILEEGELAEAATVRKFRTVQTEGTRQVNRELVHYNLDMIIAIGYRVRSSVGTQFRQWATERLKEYMVKGFALDDERLKGNGGGEYWKELLARIRDIRSSEKMLYRQVLDLYATSLDYDPHSDETIRFFQIVQNNSITLPMDILRRRLSISGQTRSSLLWDSAVFRVISLCGKISVLPKIIWTNRSSWC